MTAPEPLEDARAATLGHLERMQGLARAGDLDGASAALSLALAMAPSPSKLAPLFAGLGLSFQQQGRTDAALAAYTQALALDGAQVEALNNRAALHLARGEGAKAEAGFREALALKPDFAAALGNLTGLLGSAGEGRLSEAEGLCRDAIIHAPEMAAAHHYLGRALEAQGRTAEARDAYGRAQALNPGFEAAVQWRLALPVIPAGVAELETERAAFAAGLAALKDTPGQLVNLEAAASARWFYLAYQGRDDRPLLEDLAGLFRAKAPALTFTSPHIAKWTPPEANGRRIRLGVLSDFLRDHSVGRFYRGLIRRLDRSRFEVVVIHGPGSRRDAYRDSIDAAADKAFCIAGPLEAQRAAISSERLDALFFTDIGMAAASYWLAFARLAPVQFTSLGHPDTSGLGTVDHFVSSSLTEPEGAQRYYTEKLAELERLPTYYEPQGELGPADRATFGLPESGALYACPQSLFKIHPDFDGVLAQIAAEDPAGHIIIPEPQHRAWKAALLARWTKAQPELVERVRFMPRIGQADFPRFCAVVDVLLDPLHFGSGVTMYEGIRAGTPVITWPGQFARGRYVFGAYAQMGLADAPIASTVEQYAPLAVAIANDRDRREALREAIRAGAMAELYADTRAVRSFEAFISAACAARAVHQLSIGK